MDSELRISSIIFIQAMPLPIVFPDFSVKLSNPVKGAIREWRDASEQRKNNVLR